MAETTQTRFAPAARTSPRVCKFTPPMANHGMVTFSAAQRTYSSVTGLAVGFVPVAKYGPHTSPWEGEIGSIEQVRYLTSTILVPFTSGSGNAALATSAPLMRTDATATTYVDVYPVLIFARDAYGIVPLKGKSSMAPMVVNPKPAPGDPLGQRGTVGWKLWTGTVILQDAWMARLEVCATA